MISATQYPEGILAELHIGIRHNLVEEIVAPFAEGLQSSGADTHTLMVSQGRIEGEVHRREWIRDPADSVVVAYQWQQWMAEKGFAWLEIYRDLDWLEQLLIDDPERAQRWIPNAFNRSLRTLAVAYVRQRPDFEAIRRRCQRELRAAGVASELYLRMEQMVGALP